MGWKESHMKAKLAGEGRMHRIEPGGKAPIWKIFKQKHVL